MRAISSSPAARCCSVDAFRLLLVRSPNGGSLWHDKIRANAFSKNLRELSPLCELSFFFNF